MRSNWENFVSFLLSAGQQNIPLRKYSNKEVFYCGILVASRYKNAVKNDTPSSKEHANKASLSMNLKVLFYFAL